MAVSDKLLLSTSSTETDWRDVLYDVVAEWIETDLIQDF